MCTDLCIIKYQNCASYYIQTYNTFIDDMWNHKWYNTVDSLKKKKQLFFSIALQHTAGEVNRSYHLDASVLTLLRVAKISAEIEVCNGCEHGPKNSTDLDLHSSGLYQ